MIIIIKRKIKVICITKQIIKSLKQNKNLVLFLIKLIVKILAIKKKNNKPNE